MTTTTALVRSTALQIQLPGFLQDTVASILAFIPRLIAAIVILIIGWIIGRIVAGIVRRLVEAVNLDSLVADTPLGNILGGSESAVAQTLGKLAAYYIYFLALLAAANAIAITVLSQFLSQALTYLPAFIAGLVVIIVGFVIADYLAEIVTRSRTAQQTQYTGLLATALQLFIYYTAITLGLDTMGISTQLLNIVVRGFAYGLAAAVAIGIGGAIALGGQDYVRENVNGWMGRAGGSSVEFSDERGRGPDSEDY